jgi:Trypsin-like peptidase domain
VDAPGTLQIAEPSIKALSVHTRANGRPISSATAFVVAHDGGTFLITNWHVLAGRRPDNGTPLAKSGAIPDELEIMHTTPVMGHWEIRYQPLYDESGDPLWLEHPRFGRRVDAVALPIAPSAGIELRAYTLRRAADLLLAMSPSEPVSIVGFPFGETGGGAFGIWVKGWIATEPGVDRDGLPCFLVDSRTREGQSGSPVILFRAQDPLADDGTMRRGLVDVDELLGVYSGRINKDSDLGFVWKAEALEEIVAGRQRGPRPH